MNSVREARQALINVVNDPEVLLNHEDRGDLLYTIGLLNELDPEAE